jgi:hypothetical protein
MREFNSKRTHNKNGEELSELFISGDDGLLSFYHGDDECEVTGLGENVFGLGLHLEYK